MIRLLEIGLLFFLLFVLQNKLYARLWRLHLSVSVMFTRDHIYQGEWGELVEVIENRKRLPLAMLKVKFKTDRHLLFGDRKGSRTTDQFYRNDVFRVGSREKVTRTLKFQGGRRGYYTIDQVNLVASDLFFSHQMTAEQHVQARLYVYPRPYESQEMRLSLIWLNGEVLSRRHLLEDPFEYRGIREYQPYDDMRSINWKATAKTGAFKVNQKNYTALKSVWIFLNVQDDGILKKEDCVEMSLRIAVGLGFFFLKQGIQVSCHGNGVDLLTGKPLSIALRAGDGQADAICRGLARLDLTRPALPFGELFEEMLFTQDTGTVTCFVAPNPYEDFVTLVEKYQDTGKAFTWFYPVSGRENPPLPPKLEKQIRLIHFDAS